MRGIQRNLTQFGVTGSRWMVAVSAICVLGACTGTGSRASAHVGTYALESVDGRPLPVELDSQRVVSAELRLSADGNWSFTARHVALRDSVGQDTTVFTNQGKYTLESQTLTLLGQNAADTADTRPGIGTLANATITSTEDGRVMLYRRRPATP